MLNRSDRRRFARRFATIVVALMLVPLSATERASVRLLTIGNSFADDATAFLPEIAQAGGKCLVVFRANSGGASLERHAGHLAVAQSTPENSAARPYKQITDPITGQKRDFSLPEILRLCFWDFVTLQQVSHLSFRPESYHPYVDQLIAAVHAAAPQAEILIHETWAYREDHPFFRKNDGLTPVAMYEGLRTAYRQLAHETGYRIIPVGDAFQAARQTARWQFTEDKNFNYDHPEIGRLPDQHASLNVGWYWGKADGTIAPTLSLDAIHANTAGRYLAAAVFYLMLFDATHVPVNYHPVGLSDDDATSLRAIAEQAVTAERARIAVHDQ